MSRWVISRHERHELLAQDLAKVERTINGTPERHTKRQARQTGYRSAEGDRQRLRAIPVIAEAVGGTIPGTDPLQAYLDKEARCHRDTSHWAA